MRPKGPSSRSNLLSACITGPVMRLLLHGFNQHGAGLTAADTFGGDPALNAFTVHGVHQVQNNAVTAGAHRVPKAHGAAIDIELFAVDATKRRIQTQRVAAKISALPSCKTSQHLGGEGFVKLP